MRSLTRISFTFQLLIIMGVLLSCGVLKSSNSNNETINPDYSTDVFENVQVDENQGDSELGPSLSNSEDEFDLEQGTTSKPASVNGLFISPAFLRSLCAIGSVKAFEKMGIDLHIYSGFGVGFMTSAFFGVHGKANAPDWFLLRLKSKLQSRSAIEQKETQLLSVLKSTHGNDRIENGKFITLAPKYDPVSDQIRLFREGLVHDFVREHLYSQTDANYPRLIGRDAMVDVLSFQRKGVDTLFVIDLLEEGLNFNRPSGFLTGKYGFYASKIKEVTDPSVVVLTVNTGRHPIDSLQELQKCIKKAEDSTYDQLRLKLNE